MVLKGFLKDFCFSHTYNAKQSKAKRTCDTPGAKQSKAKRTCDTTDAKQSKAMQCKAEQSKVKQCKAMQCKAMQSNAMQSQAKQSGHVTHPKAKQSKATQRERYMEKSTLAVLQLLVRVTLEIIISVGFSSCVLLYCSPPQFVIRSVRR